VPVVALLAVLGADNVFSQIAVFFSKMAVVTFGGAYAVLAYVGAAGRSSITAAQAREMLDGLGMAETTPGPLIMVLQFVGFLAAFRDAAGFRPCWPAPSAVARDLGHVHACFLWIFVGAPYIELARDNQKLNGALSGIPPRWSAFILNLRSGLPAHGIWAGDARARLWAQIRHAILASVDPWALALSLAAIIAILRFKVA